MNKLECGFEIRELYFLQVRSFSDQKVIPLLKSNSFYTGVKMGHSKIFMGHSALLNSFKFIVNHNILRVRL